MYKLVFALFLTTSAFAQIIPTVEPIPEEVEKDTTLEKPKPLWKEKMHYGGNIWAGFGGSLFLEATPMLGFDLSEKGTVGGIGATILYNGSSRYIGGGWSIGPKLFVRQAIWRSVFAHAEYELMNSSEYNFFDTRYNYDPNRQLVDKRRWGGTGYLGLGFYQNGMRTQGGGFLSILYNLNAPNSGYINSQSFGDGRFVLRIGFFI